MYHREPGFALRARENQGRILNREVKARSAFWKASPLAADSYNLRASLTHYLSDFLPLFSFSQVMALSAPQGFSQNH